MVTTRDVESAACVLHDEAARRPSTDVIECATLTKLRISLGVEAFAAGLDASPAPRGVGKPGAHVSIDRLYLRMVIRIAHIERSASSSSSSRRAVISSCLPCRKDGSHFAMGPMHDLATTTLS